MLSANSPSQLFIISGFEENIHKYPTHSDFWQGFWESKERCRNNGRVFSLGKPTFDFVTNFQFKLKLNLSET